MIVSIPYAYKIFIFITKIFFLYSFKLAIKLSPCVVDFIEQLGFSLHELKGYMPLTISYLLELILSAYYVSNNYLLPQF